MSRRPKLTRFTVTAKRRATILQHAELEIEAETGDAAIAVMRSNAGNLEWEDLECVDWTDPTFKAWP